MKQSSQDSGFTVPELLITLIVTALFIIVFFDMFTALSIVNTSAKHRSLADNTAYSLLQRYANVSPNEWFTCNTNSALGDTNDQVVDAHAPGTTIASGSLTSAETNLPEPIHYSINALAIYGCIANNAGKPIRIIVTLSYGTHDESVNHTMLSEY